MGLKSLDYIMSTEAPEDDNLKIQINSGVLYRFFLKDQIGQVGRKTKS